LSSATMEALYPESVYIV